MALKHFVSNIQLDMDNTITLNESTVRQDIKQRGILEVYLISFCTTSYKNSGCVE
jgi:hypothetical protein